MSANIQPAPYTCPACGLLCDDITPSNNTCAKSIAFFGQKLGDATPKIKGQTVGLLEAITAAAQILKSSQKPLFAGLSTDIVGFKALENLAQKTGGALTHMNAQSMARNLKVLQSSGWQTTTLTEVKNRADLIVCIGSNIIDHNPRFFERFVDVEGMFAGGKISNREIVFLGEKSSHVKIDALNTSWILAHRADALPSVLSALHALMLGKPLKVDEIGGIERADLEALALKLKAAKYAALTWVAKDLDFNHAELTIEQITQIVATLNQSDSNHYGRAACLPLGGSDGDTSANNIHTWRNGIILDDATEANNHAPIHDTIIWVNSFSLEKLPPKTDFPLIVLGNANTQFAQIPAVFIPIATPGLDCNGTLFRVDGSVILPLKKVRDTHLQNQNLPTLSEIVRQIENALFNINQVNTNQEWLPN